MNDREALKFEPASTKTYWPLFGHTTRSEQRLLVAFRQLNARLHNRESSVQRLEATGLDADGLVACARLSRLLPQGLPDLRFLEPDSTLVTTAELHFLASLTRMARRSRDRSATGDDLMRGAPSSALHVAMQAVAHALNSAGFSVNRSSSSLPRFETGPTLTRSFRRPAAGSHSSSVGETRAS